MKLELCTRNAIKDGIVIDYYWVEQDGLVIPNSTGNSLAKAIRLFHLLKTNHLKTNKTILDTFEL
jgi:hypothetical protein